MLFDVSPAISLKQKIHKTSAAVDGLRLSLSRRIHISIDLDQSALSQHSKPGNKSNDGQQSDIVYQSRGDKERAQQHADRVRVIVVEYPAPTQQLRRSPLG